MEVEQGRIFCLLGTVRQVQSTEKQWTFESQIYGEVCSGVIEIYIEVGIFSKVHAETLFSTPCHCVECSADE